VTDSTVRVYCDEEAHAGRVATVATFTRGGEGIAVGEGMWRETAVYSRRPVDGSSEPGPGVTIKSGTSRGMFGDLPMSEVSGEDQLVALTSPRWRTKFDLTCPRCSLRVQLRAEKLEQVLDTLAAAEVAEVRLSALAASL
jgi:hypothetical protein